jgi:type IV secretory pathway protease TraF
MQSVVGRSGYGCGRPRSSSSRAWSLPRHPNLSRPSSPRAGYLPGGVSLIKRIAALPGQSVCRNELLISVDGLVIGVARNRDHVGRTLPVWRGCRLVAEDEVFLMNRDEPASLDGRYFGPIPSTAIVGQAEPLWTFEKE